MENQGSAGNGPARSMSEVWPAEITEEYSVRLGGPCRIAKVDHDAMLPAEGLGAAQVAQLEASIREAERDVRGWSPPGSDKVYDTREQAEAFALEAGYYPGQADLVEVR